MVRRRRPVSGRASLPRRRWRPRGTSGPGPPDVVAALPAGDRQDSPDPPPTAAGPGRHERADLLVGEALPGAVVHLQQARVRLRIASPGEPAGRVSTARLQRARDHPLERDPGQPPGPSAAACAPSSESGTSRCCPRCCSGFERVVPPMPRQHHGQHARAYQRRPRGGWCGLVVVARRAGAGRRAAVGRRRCRSPPLSVGAVVVWCSRTRYAPIPGGALLA